ncbi:MAG: hypothetical protein NTV48_03430 [Candidatus Vogelbacteria bacterium]|nr:hypothetical protein [Candidatus Vogelbacteria bacterium]
MRKKPAPATTTPTPPVSGATTPPTGTAPAGTPPAPTPPATPSTVTTWFDWLMVIVLVVIGLACGNYCLRSCATSSNGATATPVTITTVTPPIPFGEGKHTQVFTAPVGSWVTVEIPNKNDRRVTFEFNCPDGESYHLKKDNKLFTVVGSEKNEMGHVSSPLRFEAQAIGNKAVTATVTWK